MDVKRVQKKLAKLQKRAKKDDEKLAKLQKRARKHEEKFTKQRKRAERAKKDRVNLTKRITKLKAKLAAAKDSGSKNQREERNEATAANQNDGVASHDLEQCSSLLSDDQPTNTSTSPSPSLSEEEVVVQDEDTLKSKVTRCDTESLESSSLPRLRVSQELEPSWSRHRTSGHLSRYRYQPLGQLEHRRHRASSDEEREHRGRFFVVFTDPVSGSRGLPVWDGSADYRPLFTPSSLDPARFVEIEVGGAQYAFPRSLWDMTEPVRANISDAVAAYLWDLLACRITADAPEPVMDAVKHLCRTVNIRVDMSDQPIWRRMIVDRDFLSGMVVGAAAGVQATSEYFPEVMTEMGFRGLAEESVDHLRLDAEGRLEAYGQSGQRFCRTDPDKWRPGLISKTRCRGTIIKVYDEDFRQKHQDKIEQLDWSNAIGRRTPEKDRKGRAMELSFNDCFSIDQRLIQRLYTMRPYTAQSRTRAQRAFARSVGNSMGYDVRAEDNSPLAEELDTKLEDLEGDYGEGRNETLVRQVQNAINHVVGFVARHLALTPDRAKRRKALSDVRDAMVDLRDDDPRGTPADERYSYSFFFREARNRKNTNLFVSGQLNEVLLRLFKPDAIREMDSDIWREMVKATRKYIDLPGGDHRPTA